MVPTTVLRRLAALALTPCLLWQASTIHAAMPAEVPAGSVLDTENSSDVDSYLAEIARLELEQGAFSPSLSEQLLGLGMALQQSGLHAEAIAAFKRGVHIARVNDGLYSRSQLPLLESEINSYMALGQFEAADERYRYLFRVQQQVLTDTRLRGQALMSQARWQRRAYELGIDDYGFNRLLNMWNLYRSALTEYADKNGKTAPELLPPLYGMLRAQYLISSFNGQPISTYRMDDPVAQQEEARFYSYRNQSFQQGRSVIRAIYDVEQAQPGASALKTIDSVVMMGDWMLWHDKRDEAYEAYDEALAAIDLLPDELSELQYQRLFALPRLLPAIEGVELLPDTVPESQANLLVEFDVSERGRVSHVERVDDGEDNEAVANRFMRQLRRARFRPRYDDGMPVATEKLVWAYDTTKW
jgi:hypothetical protein